MCFGDSLTWGWIPQDPPFPSRRYERDQRWTGVLATRLGDGFVVIEEGLVGRTTTAEDTVEPWLSGASHLPAALSSNLPLDLVILLLGTNDTKATVGRTPTEIGLGMSRLVEQVLTSAGASGTTYPAPEVLVVAPPPLATPPDPWFAVLYAGAREKSVELAAVYAALARFHGVPFFDAGSAISTDGIDGLHLTEQNNLDLGIALTAEVRRLMGAA